MKNGFWTWLISILSVGSLGALYGWKGGQSLLFLLLLLVIVIIQGAAVQLFGPKQAKVERTWYPLNPRAGEEVEVTLTITLSGGFLPLWMQAEDEWSASRGTEPGSGQEPPGGKLAFGGWKRKFTGTYLMREMSRGVYAGQTVRITWGDSFGWFKRSLRAEANDVLVIHPAPLPVELSGTSAADPDGDEQGAGRNTEAEANFDAGRLRAYESGDPLRRIHWKSSAKKGILLTRLPEPSESKFRCLFLDTAASSYSESLNGYRGGKGTAVGNETGPKEGNRSGGFELAVSAAAAWLGRELGRTGEACLRHGGVRELAIKAPPIFSGNRGLKEGLDLLAGTTLDPGLSGSELLRSTHASLHRQSLTFITGRLTPELGETALQLAERGAALEIWYACGTKGNAESTRLAQSLIEKGLILIDLTRYTGVVSVPSKGGAKHGIA